jgi:hypothetical protein
VVNNSLDAHRLFHRQLPSCFNLWCVIYTESDPQGGWWFTSKDGGGRVAPDVFLHHMLVVSLDDVADQALSAHVIMVTCGVNLVISEECKLITELLSR